MSSERNRTPVELNLERLGERGEGLCSRGINTGSSPHTTDEIAVSGWFKLLQSGVTRK